MFTIIECIQHFYNRREREGGEIEENKFYFSKEIGNNYQDVFHLPFYMMYETVNFSKRNE